MKRKNIIISVLVVVIIAVAVAGGSLWWHHHKSDQKKQLDSARQAVASQSEPTNSDGTVNISTDGAQSLGQLFGNQTDNSGGSTGSSGNNGELDPSTFAQYDKYKNNKTALFGEVKPGDGAALKVGQKASIYYKGWLTNGALVDQSPVSAAGQPQPYSFTLGAHQVIIGLEEGIAGMKVGGTRLIIIPPSVGYGSKGQGAVPSNAVLIFEVQLVSAK